MGIQFSSDDPTPQPLPATPVYKHKGPQTKDVFRNMTQKVLQSQEELYARHASRNPECLTQRTEGRDSELYYDYLTHRQDTAEKEKEPLQRIESVRSLQNTSVNSKYNKSRVDPHLTVSENRSKNNTGTMTLTMGSTSTARTTTKGKRSPLPRSRNSRPPVKPQSHRAVASGSKPIRGSDSQTTIPNSGEETKSSVKRMPLPQKPEVEDDAADEFQVREDTDARMNVRVCHQIQRVATAVCDCDTYHKSVALRYVVREGQKLPQFDQISLLPANIFMTILSYSIDGFRSWLSVNPSWYHSIIGAFDNKFNTLENSFVNLYAPYLLFKDSYTSSSIMKFCDMGAVRVDRVIKCENLETTLGKSLLISYTYRYCSEPASTYKAEFIFDSVGRTGTYMWAHKNECNVFSRRRVTLV